MELPKQCNFKNCVSNLDNGLAVQAEEAATMSCINGFLCSLGIQGGSYHTVW